MTSHFLWASRKTPLQNRGRNFVRSKRWFSYMSRTPSTYFFVLTIRKQLPGNDFERSSRGQEPSRGHKFSILENFLSIRDFTSSMRLHFRSDLVGVALVGATPLHLLSQTALPLKSPTGAFIAPLRFANAVPPKTLLRADEEELCQFDTIPPTIEKTERSQLLGIRKTVFEK